VRPEQAPLLNSYLSSLAVGHYLYLWHVFSYVMSCFGFWVLDSLSASFQSTSVFYLRVFASLLSGFLLPFLCLKGLVCAKLFVKLGCCRTLCPFS
jgi:hypothetical protein